MRRRCRSSLERFPHQRPPCFSQPSSLPSPFFDHDAFTSQLDEVDRILRAFMVQGQRARQSIPADEDTDERMMDSDEESNRRWSSSTDSTATILATSDALARSAPATHDIPDLQRASAIFQFHPKAHSSTSTFRDITIPHTDTVSAPRDVLLLQPVGHAVHQRSELNVEDPYLRHPGLHSDRGSPVDVTDNAWDRLCKSGNRGGSVLIPQLETSLGPLGLDLMKEDSLASTMSRKGDNQTTASRTEEAPLDISWEDTKGASLNESALGDAVATDMGLVPKMDLRANGNLSRELDRGCAENQYENRLEEGFGGVVIRSRSTVVHKAP
ncbi:MAG: hypothetical protein M1830_004995 [Pleopsidium flavum]|nr:MAG: hypothetical protein M1830_004995 [Pleopsidium flavum]